MQPGPRAAILPPTTTLDSLPTIARRAIERRRDLLTRLHAESTDCYRLLHGVAEDAPGVTLDRYGPLLLLQTFREPLPATAVDDLRQAVRDGTGLELEIVHNHRGEAPAVAPEDRESPRLNSSHLVSSYAVFLLKKKINIRRCYF